MCHIPEYSPPAFGAPPKISLLTSLSGKWIPVMRTVEIEGFIPKRFKIWTTFRYLEEVSVVDILEWRLRFQIYNKGDSESFQFYDVKMLSCGLSSSVRKDEEICIEVEVSEREDDRLTEEEIAYIRKLDKIGK